ncbi:MAG: TonB-dependent receptor [Steroidobacteraceae bacterium]
MSGILRRSDSFNAVLATAVSMVCLQSAAQAAEPLLEEVIVTADRLALPLDSIPASVRSVDADAIARLPIRDTATALAVLPNVTIRRSGSVFDEASISVYGISAQPRAPSRTVIAIDGVPLNSGVIPETSLNLLPLSLAQRIDVIQGPGSVGYGSNATTGVVNMVTRSPAALTGELSIAAADQWNTRDVGGLIGGGDGTTQKWLAAGSWRTTDGHLQPGGRKDFSDSELWNAALVGRQTWGRATLSGAYLRYAFDRHDPSTLLVGFPANVTAREESGWRDHFNVGLGWDWSSSLTGELRFVRNASTEESAQTFQQPAVGQAAANPTDQDAKSQGVLGQVTWKAGIHLVSVGAEYQSADLTNNLNGQVFSGHTTGAFAQYRLALLDDRLSFLAGYRFDDSSIYPESSSSPKIGVVWRSVNDAWRVRANVSKAFNAPTFNELFSTGFIRGNAALKAQTLDLREVGLTWQPAQQVSLDLSVYRAKLANPIFPRVNPALGVGVRQYQNVGPDVVNDGFVLSAAWSPLVGLNVSGSWTYLDPGDFTFHTAENSFKAQADYAHGSWFVGIAARHESDRYWRDNFESPADDYTVVDARGGWSFNRNLKIEVSVENLTDEDYATTASIGPTTSVGIPRPGRFAMFQIKTGF